MFYNGNPKVEPGAVVCRLSPTFIRFGTFELPSIRGGKDMALVQQLADFVIRHYYTDVVEEKDYKGFLREVEISFFFHRAASGVFYLPSSFREL